MTTLAQALSTASWRWLKVIGRQRGLRFASNISKATLLARLLEQVPDPAALAVCLAQLPAPTHQLLDDLRLAGGALPLRYLHRRYGPLSPQPELIKKIVAQAPLTPPEHLLALGLIFYDKPESTLFIPADLAAHLPAPAQTRPRALPQASGLAPVSRLCHDLAALLALLQRDAPRPLHQRWLPPHFLITWGHHCAQPPASPSPRSELQTNRRRFLHYLAESAGLVSSQQSVDSRQESGVSNLQSPISNPQSLNSPLPAASLWLAATPADRLHTLWAAWCTPDLERWQRYRLPGHDWLTGPDRLLAALHPALLDLDPARFATLLLTHQPHLLDLVPLNHLDPVETFSQTVIDLLTGPLVWLGILEDGRMEYEVRSKQNVSPPANLPTFQPSFHLTPHGHALLTHTPLPPFPPPAIFTLQPDLQADPLHSRLTFIKKEGLPDPADLALLLETAEPSRGAEGRGSRGAEEKLPITNDQSKIQNLKSKIEVTAATFTAALHRGWSPPALRDRLNRLADRPLTRPETDLLRAWAAAAEKTTLHPAFLLETTDPEVITRLAATRRGRALIQRTLSPRAIIIDPTRLDQLVRRLTEQEGIPPKVVRSKEYEVRREMPTQPPSSLLPPSYSQHLWLAAQLYHRLGRHLPLPVRLPQTLFDNLAGQLSPTDLAAAEVAVEQTLAALQALIDGRPPTGRNQTNLVRRSALPTRLDRVATICSG